MKRKLFSIVLLVITCLSTIASASSTTKSATLVYKDIKIVLDGQVITPCDANGTFVEPFLIKGTTYLPVRAVGNAVGLSVDWDANTNTVVLKSGGQPVSASASAISSAGPREASATLVYKDIKITLDGKEITPTDANNIPVEPFVIDGTTYLPVRGVASALGLSVGWDGSTNTVILSTQSYESTTNTVSQPTVPNEPSSNDWVKIDRASLDFLLDGALEGNVIYRNGEYWAKKNYVDAHTNENIIAIIDVAGQDEYRTPEQQYVDNFNANTEVHILVGIEALSEIRNHLLAEELRDFALSGSASMTSSVTDIDVLQYCMPSLPDDFIENPVDGIYDGIHVVVQDGVIKMYEEDLIAKGFIS